MKGLLKGKKLDVVDGGQQHKGNCDAYSTWYAKIAPDLNTHIDCMLMDISCHPTQIMEAQDDDQFPNISMLASKAPMEAGPFIFESAVANGINTLEQCSSGPQVTPHSCHHLVEEGEGANTEVYHWGKLGWGEGNGLV